MTSGLGNRNRAPVAMVTGSPNSLEGNRSLGRTTGSINTVLFSFHGDGGEGGGGGGGGIMSSCLWFGLGTRRGSHLEGPGRRRCIDV